MSARRRGTNAIPICRARCGSPRHQVLKCGPGRDAMNLTRDQVKVLAAAVGLEIPDRDLDNVTIRVVALLSAMEKIEAEMGAEMDAVDPLPPVFPREDF